MLFVCRFHGDVCVDLFAEGVWPIISITGSKLTSSGILVTVQKLSWLVSQWDFDTAQSNFSSAYIYIYSLALVPDVREVLG
jgi:hypothetical protein